MRTTTPTRRWAIVGLISALGLAGCGKKGKLSPPEGEEALYTHPQVYPKPSSQVPGWDDEKPRQDTVSDDISIFPDDRTKTKTY